MSLMDSNDARTHSPLPLEPDIGLCIRITVPNEHELRFIACISAAVCFALHWSTECPAVTVTFEQPHPQGRRLPCERLWTLP